MRNRLIHGYDMVDWAVLQSTVSVDLPQLVARLDATLGQALFQSVAVHHNVHEHDAPRSR